MSTNESWSLDMQEVADTFVATFTKYNSSGNPWHTEDLKKLVIDFANQFIEKYEDSLEHDTGQTSVISTNWIEIAPVQPSEALYAFMRWLWRQGGAEQAWTVQALCEALERFRAAAGWKKANPEVVQEWDHI